MSELTSYNFCQETLQLKNVIESSFLSLGERLRKIRSDNLFKDQWSSFGEFCQEMKMSEGTASKLINIYEKFIVMYQINPERLLSAGGWGVVAECLPMIKSKEDAELWLDKCQILSREDLRIEVRAAKTGIDPIDCDHADSYELHVCRKCGNKQTIYEHVETN